jgi:hypothetical protein
MPRSAHSLRFRLLILMTSTLSSMLTVPAMARTVTASCPGVTGNQPMDVYCGALNGLAAAPQFAAIGFTNCPNTY